MTVQQQTVNMNQQNKRQTPLAPIKESPPKEGVAVIKADEDGDVLDSSPLWNGANEGWELTWPIWHMLPLRERKIISQRHGYKTIGEFEEYMSLQQAVDDSEILTSRRSTVQRPYTNEFIYPSLESTNGSDEQKSSVGEESKNDGENDDDDDSVDDGQAPSYERQASTFSAAPEEIPLEELIELGGQILMLSDEMLHNIFSWLPVDSYGTLALVSPHWKHLTRTESVYKRLCERLYLNQSKRRQLHVSRFGGSYRRMLVVRPRVRAAGGCYVLKYSQIKPIQRDMWTEIPVGAILESIYYRYLYFQEDGRVLYALSSSPPHEMFRRLLKVVLDKTTDNAAVWGSFQVQKTNCTIIAKQDWHTVKFDLSILPSSAYGRFAAMTMDSHYTSPSGCFEDWSRDRVEYKVPTEMFRFIKDPRL